MVDILDVDWGRSPCHPIVLEHNLLASLGEGRRGGGRGGDKLLKLLSMITVM